MTRAGRYLAFTYAALGKHLILLWVVGLVAAAFEGLGILLFIPILLQFASQEAAHPPGRLANAVSSWAEGHSIETLLVMLVLLFAAKGALVFAIGVYRSHVLSRTRERMRLELFDALEKVRVRELESRRLGSIGNLLLGEIDRAGFAMGRLCAAVGTLTTAAFLFAIAVALQPALSVVLLASGGLSLLVVRQLVRWRMVVSREATESAGDMASIAAETIQSVKYLRATNRFSIFREVFGGMAKRTRRLENRAARVDYLRHGIREPLLVMWIGAVFYVFVVVLRQSLGVITDGILFFYRVSIELTIFQDQAQEFAGGVGSIDAYERLRVELDRAAEPPERGAPLRFEREIRLDGIGFGYGELPVLSGLEMSIPKLRTVALVGASGAGKSTVVDLVAACLEPREGAVLVDGVDLRDVRRSEYRSALGYVTQESVIFSASVARNVTMCWGGAPSGEQLERAREAARLANCLDLIESLEHGWDTELGERGVRLSGGERQRIAIARELYGAPQLLILDEATSALDSISERAVQRSLDLLHGRLTLLIVAHRLSTIRYADVIYVLEDGRVAESGSFDDLSRRPRGRFRELCEMQSLV